MATITDIDTFSRFAGYFIEQNPSSAEKGIEAYEEALEKLKNLNLLLVGGSKLRESMSLQAALITSVNCGKRAFQGGVDVLLEDSIPLLLPWPNKAGLTLNEVVEEIGGKIIRSKSSQYSFCINVGLKTEEEDSIELVCNGWQGGFRTYNESWELNNESDLPLGGILAGALGVASAFLKVSGEKPDACFTSQGLSLWRPDICWLDENAAGPKVTYFPQRYWLVGLGHLGQAFAWTIGLLPFSNPSEVTVFLQDFETISKSNYDTGLLSEEDNTGSKKTRVVSSWLEQRGMQTTLIERAFDRTVYSMNNEPKVLIRGLDTKKSRRDIDMAGFDQVIDCGIGGTKGDFDSISVFNFPACKKTVTELWDGDDVGVINAANEKAMRAVGCGFYGKGISTSFVGTFASTLVLAELIRSGYQGLKTSQIIISMRSLQERFFSGEGNYMAELAGNGYC